MNCNYKVNIKDIQNKYKFNIFAMGGYNDSDLRKMIESVFYALPRTTASGTSVTLNDTAFSYMKNKLYATDTSQYTTTGKNKASNVWEEYTQSTGTANYRLYPLTLEQGKTYILSGALVGTKKPSYYNFGIVKDGDNYNNFVDPHFAVDYNTGNGQQYTFTVDNSFISPKLICYVTSKSIFEELFTNYNIQLEEGSSVTSFEEYTGGIASPNPDYPQVIHTITGDNKILVEGRNLAPTNWASSFVSAVDNSGYASIENKDNRSCLNYREMAGYGSYDTKNFTLGMTFKENTQYTLSLDIYKDTSLSATLDIEYTDGTVSTISPVSAINTWEHKTLTSSANKTIKSIHPRYTAGRTYIDINTWQIEEGTSASQYEPYKSNSVILTLGDKEICKIGNYEDKIFKAIKGNEVYDSLASEEKATLDYGKWYLRKAIGKVVLNGSENYTEFNNTFILNFDFNPQIKPTGSNGEIPLIKCDYLLPITWNESWATLQSFFAMNTNREKRIRMSLPNMSVADFKTELQNNNMSIYYVTEILTNEKFNDTSQDQLEDIYNNMLSYEGQTNVSQVNDDLPFNINSTAIKDLNDL